ncbi:MAG: hypothetical protein N3D82_05385 [Ignisphaera sp.]|nr:hypothetical protein [Ignisphaera sp.]MDW8085121.1 hypothetical protein [Ignisphaera sp.]
MEPEFTNFVLDNFVIKSFYSKKGRITLALVPKGLADLLQNLLNTKVIGSGLLCGWIDEGKFIPAPHLFNFSRRCGFRYGCGVVVKPQGVKAFLYGNDVLLASFDRFVYPVRKGDYIAVVDPGDMHVIGIGMLLADEHDIERLAKEGRVLAVIVKNIFDLGIHIRNEELFLH